MTPKSTAYNPHSSKAVVRLNPESLAARKRHSEEPAMALSSALRNTILNAWSTNNRITIYLVEELPDTLWTAAIPGSPMRTIRMLAGHIHNARCMWIKTLGRPHGLKVPPSVDRRRVTRAQLIRALKVSGGGIDRKSTRLNSSHLGI